MTGGEFLAGALIGVYLYGFVSVARIILDALREPEYRVGLPPISQGWLAALAVIFCLLWPLVAMTYKRGPRP